MVVCYLILRHSPLGQLILTSNKPINVCGDCRMFIEKSITIHPIDHFTQSQGYILQSLALISQVIDHVMQILNGVEACIYPTNSQDIFKPSIQTLLLLLRWLQRYEHAQKKPSQGLVGLLPQKIPSQQCHMRYYILVLKVVPHPQPPHAQKVEESHRFLMPYKQSFLTKRESLLTQISP